MIKQRGNILECLGELIKLNRQTRNLTLLKISLASGISIRDLEAIENGKIDFAASTFNKIYLAMDIDLVMTIEMRKEMITLFKNSTDKKQPVYFG